MNNCCFIGRFGRDPELKSTTGGKPVLTFSLAVRRDGKDAGSDWINFVAWDNNAESLSRNCRKGDMIGIVGTLHQRDYETKDGRKNTVHEVNVRRFYFIGGKPAEKKVNTFEEIPDEETGDLPF